ncbi:GNAT family N-acetyltransferase [Bacteroides sp. UBA939]|uniref:GNAT family N-acetyltransferase n=1 Tax=Bacteroides sp. UBA939 TaxID=1946092 RepID=UPI0025BFC661|nr:GNAT family N-acetyltransferase [Bacteroides sp. UBA939]
MEITIRKIKDNYPYNLLLQADETHESINKYLFDSAVYEVLLPEREEPVGVFCLYQVDTTTIELKNIAVDEPFRGMGTGSVVLARAVEIAATDGYREMIIGTGTEDCAPALVRFYERNGFHKSGVRENFFVDNFPEPIYENGVQLKDMLILSRDIEKYRKPV